MFTYHEPETAPEESKELLEESLRENGMIPNLHKVMAESPVAFKAYMTASSLFSKNSSLSPVERQVVLMTANFENNCHYCIPGHTWTMKAAKMPEDVIEALREGTTLPDPKLQALREYAKALLDMRGHIGKERLQAFLNAGYNKRQALEVLAGLSAKLISGFTNAITNTELDEPMKKFAWTHPSKRSQ